MAILSGKRLGPYEILSAIGAGGLGEVYRARDTPLERIVAVKILPDHLADRADLRERFEREARTVASLNHPHICTLHDIGHQDGTDFLVMEYLEGELFYRSGEEMLAVEVTTQPSFSVGKPRMLYQGTYLPSPLTSPNYDVSPDGQRFLMLKPSESAEAPPAQIVFVQNWFEELKRRVPTGK